jgi:hypothetical protein
MSKISELPNALTLTGAELVPVVQNGDDAQTTVSAIKNYLNVSILSPSGDTAGVTDQSVIQTALNSAGLVNLAQAGTFWINKPLIVYSNTDIVCGANTNIRLAPNCTCPLLMPASLVTALGGGTTTLTGGVTVTLTQGTGNAVNVAWTGHGQSVGDGVWIYNNGVSAYNGVFRVGAVVDANNFTVYTPYYTASAPSGTTRALPAVKNFNLTGGTWNYDYLNQAAPGNLYTTMAIHLVGLMNSSVTNVTSINARKYQFNIQAVNGLYLNNLRVANQISDGLKIYGPSNGVKLDGMYGYAADDFVSLQTNEGTGFQSFQFNQAGDILNVSVNNLNFTGSSVSNPCKMYPSDNEIMDAIEVDGVYGTAASYGVSLNKGLGYTTGVMGRVKLRNINSQVAGTLTPTIQVSTVSIDHLTIEDCSFLPGSTVEANKNYFLTLNGAGTIKTLVLNRIKSNGYPSSNTVTVALIDVNSSTVRKMVIRDCEVIGATGGGTFPVLYLENALNVFGDLIVDGGYYDASVSAFVQFNAALASGTPNFRFRGVNLTCTNVIVNNYQGMHASFEGNTIAATNLVRNGAGSLAIKIASAGNNDFGSTVTINPTGGTPSVTLYGNDLKYDAGLTATTQGQFFYHSSAVAGRNAANQQGLCIGVDGTHFYAIGTGASGVNTLIV